MNRIKEILETKGISQTWLAKQIGKSYCIVNAYACNRRQPNLELMFDIAKALNVDVKELIADDKN
ncbi:MAG: helix-turn-helix transcriptional regulator [Rikenellaceae bacterium]